MIDAGYAPAGIKFNKPFDCPFCKGSQCAFVFIALPGESELFKCINDPCPRDNDVLDAIEFIAIVRQISKDAATQAYFTEARIYAQKHRLGDEPLVEKCIEIIRDRHDASIAVFQRILRVGFNRAYRVMKILESQGIVGPYRTKPARDILKLPDLPPSSPPAAVMRAEVTNIAGESPLQPVEPTSPEQANQITGLKPPINIEIVGPYEPMPTRDIVKLPDLKSLTPPAEEATPVSADDLAEPQAPAIEPTTSEQANQDTDLESPIDTEIIGPYGLEPTPDVLKHRDSLATPPPDEQPTTMAVNYHMERFLAQPVEPGTLAQTNQTAGEELATNTGISVETSAEKEKRCRRLYGRR